MRRPRLSPLSARAISGPLTLLLAAVVLAAAGGLLIWNGNPPVHAQMVSAPEKPTGLSAADGPGGGQASLTWDAATDTNITGYEYSQAAELVKLTASDGSRNDQLGYSVSVDGDTMVVGVWNDDDKGHDSGSARVFVKPSDGKWSDASQVATLTASDGSATDGFGYSVSVDGDTVVVGAWWVDNDYGIDSGSAYVFVRPSTGWANTTQTAILAATDGRAYDLFGAAVSVSGDTVVVGAEGDDCSDGANCGSVYVYVRPSTGWKETNETAKLTASDEGGGDKLGWFVSVDGDTMVAGATHDDDTGVNSGAAYVFVKPSAGWVTATETAKLTASDAGAGDAFGYAVSVDGDTVVVGAHQDDDNGSDSGSAYVFVRPSAGWASATQTAKLTASDAAANDEFGLSVAVGGDTVVVGAHQDDDNVADSGSAYVFAKPSAGWAAVAETTKLTASDGGGSDHFGFSVAADGDTVAVGASHDNTPSVNSGSAYVFQVKPWTPIPGSGATTTSHTVTGLTNYQPYTFWLRVVNAVAASLAAGPVKATPPANGDPAFAADTATLEVVENSDGGTNVGSAFTATDPDGDTLAYSLSGTDAASFALNSSTGQISVGSSASLDYETKDSYTVTVSVHDGKDAEGTAETTATVDDTIDVTINVTDVDLPLTPGAPTVKPAATNGHTTFEVAWAAPGITGWPYLTGYNVRYRKSGASSDWTLRTSRGAVPASTTRIVISGLESSTGYEVQISAINDEGESGWSDSGTSTTDTAILDLTVQFSAATYEATEGGAATTITVLISPPANREVVVGIKSNPRAGTTFDAGEFEIVGLTGGVTLTINRDDATKSFTVQAQHDDDGVHDQIDLGFFDLPTQVRAGEPSSAVLTVTDDEGGTVTLSDEQPEVGVTISATLADPPGPVTGIRWVWSRSVDGLANWNDISDATSASYTPVAADRGNYLRATATYTDDQGPGQKAWKVTANIVRDVDQQPARPSELAATAGLERVRLSWEDPGDSSITGYEFYQAAELARLTASDGAANDNFGWSVSVGGDTMVVGAYSDDDNGADSGSAYVFVRPAGEDWSEATQVAKLTASDGAGGDEFGRAVSVDGDTIAVGAYGDDTLTGSAYVFVKPSTGWATATETAKLTASDGVADDQFGWSVSVDGDTMVVGVRMDDGSGSNSGSAYVFVKPSTGWATTTETAKLTASDGAAGDRFGTSVSVGGDTIAVGVYRDDDNGADSGSAYVFVRPSDGEWTTATETAKLTASDGAANDEFGWSVSVDGDTMVVGAPLDDGSGSNSGSAYVFVKPSTGWATTTETAKLTASDGAEGDRFGTSVSVGGDTIAVGAYGDDTFTGSAYLFVKPATGWAATTEALKLAASDGAVGDYFGFSVSVDGNTVVAGAFLDDDNGSVSGSAYAFAVSGWMRIGGSGTGTIEHTVEELDGWIEHTFGIRAVNGGGLGPASRSVTATPSANRAPEFAMATATHSVAENTAAGRTIGGPVTAADPDSGDTLVYNLSGVDAASFDIDTATGQITVGSETSLDYETKASYTVTVSVHDGRDSGGNADTTEDDSVEVTINLTNVDEAGSVILAPTQPVLGTALTATLADPDGNVAEVVWQWASSTDGSTGWTDISDATSASYTLTADDVGSYLRATASYTDGHGSGKSAQGVSANTVVAAAQVNNPPAIAPDRGTSSDGSGGGGGEPVALTPVIPEGVSVIRELAENSDAGAKVGGPRTTTESEGGQLTYSLGGKDAAHFNIDPGTGQITLGGGVVLDYESGKRTYTVDVLARTSTGDISKTSVTVAVTNVDEPGTIIVSPDTGLMAGATLTARLTDPDGGVTGEAWRWQRSTDGTTWTDIGGAASASYSLTTADAGTLLRAAVSYADALGTGLSLAGEALSRVEAAPQPQPTPTLQPMATPEPTLEPTRAPMATPTAQPTSTPAPAPTAEPTPTPPLIPTAVVAATPRPLPPTPTPWVGAPTPAPAE